MTAAPRAQQYVFRSHAEQLKKDWQNLSYGVDNFEQTRKSLERWHPKYDHGSAWCRGASCIAEIALGDFSHSHRLFFSRHPRCLRLYEILGGRTATLTARITFEKNSLSAKAMEAKVFVTPSEMVPPTAFGTTLIGITSVPSTIFSRRTDPRHPTYEIGSPSGCEICVMIFVNIHQDASRADMKRLSNINLSCFTRWFNPCREKSDIMPAAFAEAQQSGS